MPAVNQIFEPVKIDHCCHTVNCITTMVSFEDLRNMRLHYADSQQPVDTRFKSDLIILWIFSICYLISVNSSKAATSIMALLGMYYAISDMTVYYYTNYIVKNDTVNPEYDNTEDDGNQTVNSDDENELSSEMKPFSFGKSLTCENGDENTERNEKALKQLRAYEEKIRQKNLQVDEYLDLPPLIKADSIDWTSTNLLSYMNPSLRQPGQYAPSINEGDE